MMQNNQSVQTLQNERINNILITGKRQVGKTTLIKNVINSLEARIAGYQTIPYEVQGCFAGYEMMNLVTKERQPISKKQKDGSFLPVIETFETFGVACLKHAVQSKADIVVLDEIGRFERTSENFIQQIHQLLSSEKYILAVLKKEPIAFIETIKQRKDVILLDLDEIQEINDNVKDDNTRDDNVKGDNIKEDSNRNASNSNLYFRDVIFSIKENYVKHIRDSNEKY